MKELFQLPLSSSSKGPLPLSCPPRHTSALAQPDWSLLRVAFCGLTDTDSAGRRARLAARSEKGEKLPGFCSQTKILLWAALRRNSVRPAASDECSRSDILLHSHPPPSPRPTSHSTPSRRRRSLLPHSLSWRGLPSTNAVQSPAFHFRVPSFSVSLQYCYPGNFSSSPPPSASTRFSSAAASSAVAELCSPQRLNLVLAGTLHRSIVPGKAPSEGAE